MKELPLLLIIYSLFGGCDNNTVYKVEEIDSLMERDMLDSARMALSDVDNDNKAVMRFMAMSPDAFRTMKSRLKNK